MEEFDGFNVTDGSDVEVAEAVGIPVERLTVNDVWRRMAPENGVMALARKRTVSVVTKLTAQIVSTESAV